MIRNSLKLEPFLQFFHFGNVNTIIPTSMVAAETKLQDFATKPLPSVGTDVASLSDRATRLGLGD